MVGARACHSRALGKQSSTLLSRLHDMRLTRAAGTWAATIPRKVDADWSRPAARLAVCLCAGHQEGCVRQRRPSRQRMRTGPPPRALVLTLKPRTWMINSEQQQHAKPSRRLGVLHSAHPANEHAQPAVLSSSPIRNFGSSDPADSKTTAAHTTPWSSAWRIRLVFGCFHAPLQLTVFVGARRWHSCRGALHPID